MSNIKVDELEVGKVVYYIPDFLKKVIGNAERGIISSAYVSTIKGVGIWVRYTDGDTGAKTDIKDLYV